MSDITKHLRWCAIHGDQMQAIKAMEQGADEIDRLRSKLGEVLDELGEVLDENDRLKRAKPVDNRETRAGRHLHETACKLGWLDDGEGAQEYVMRQCYEQGREDARHDAALETKP